MTAVDKIVSNQITRLDLPDCRDLALVRKDLTDARPIAILIKVRFISRCPSLAH